MSNLYYINNVPPPTSTDDPSQRVNLLIQYLLSHMLKLLHRLLEPSWRMVLMKSLVFQLQDLTTDI